MPRIANYQRSDPAQSGWIGSRKTQGATMGEGAIESWASSPRSRQIMRSNRSRDTAPELAVRRLLHLAGLRYRVAYRPIPQLRRTADIVFTRQRIAVFIDGCFWHGCPEHGQKTTRANADYWSNKFMTNSARDAETNRLLRDAGWYVVRFWAHESPDAVARAIRAAVLGSPRPPIKRLTHNTLDSDTP